MSLALSILALLATFYQAYLQRRHNEKSIKPLLQIDLMDNNGVLFVHVQNNGVGPMVVDKLSFTKADQSYTRIEDCISIDPKSYNHIEITDTNKKIIIPGQFLEVFAKQFDPKDDQATVDSFRRELSGILFRVDGHDIYDNKVATEKSLKWFARHLQ